MSLTTKLGKPHNPLITWFCEFTKQTKVIASPLTQFLWSPNLVGWQLTFKSSYEIS